MGDVSYCLNHKVPIILWNAKAPYSYEKSYKFSQEVLWIPTLLLKFLGSNLTK